MKKQSVIKMALVFFFSSVLLFSCLLSEGNAFLKGDINNDGKIDLAESVNALQVSAGLKTAQPSSVINVPADVSTIQEAIDTASEGETIIIAAGTYDEVLNISKDNISIQGAGKESTIIRGNGTDRTIVLRNSRNITISSLAVQNGDIGINTYYSSLVCFNVVIENNYRGLRARYNSYVTAENTFIRNNTYGGVRLNNGSAGNFTDCEITGNGGIGFVCDRSSSVSIESCKVLSNGEHGIQAWLDSNVSCSGSEIKLNGGPGFDISGNSSGQLFGANVISENGDDIDWAGGVTIHHSSYCLISDTNQIIDNRGAGVKIFNNSVGDIGPILIHDNDENGVNIQTGSVAQFDGTVITKNGGYGIDPCWNGDYFVLGPVDFGSAAAGTANTLGDVNPCE